MINSPVKRESSFELIRLIAQFLIVYYHIFLFFIAPNYDNILYKSIQLPLHIGVLLFVLISGYWGIKCSPKGFVKLVGIMFVYTVPLQLLYAYLEHGIGIKDIILNLLFISNTPYWFMRTYICLYLFSPVINTYLDNISLKKRISLICSLAFISVYIGSISVCDPTLTDGKNLVYFIFLYVLGNTLRIYKDLWKSISIKVLIAIYLLLNIALVSLYSIYDTSFIGNIIWHFSFRYCSPLLLINSLLFFVIIAKFPFKSRCINYLSASSLAIYLLHGSPIVFYKLIGPVSLYIKSQTSNEILFFVELAVFSVIIMLFCILIDKLLNPVWKMVNAFGGYVAHRLELISNKQFSKAL